MNFIDGRINGLRYTEIIEKNYSNLLVRYSFVVILCFTITMIMNTQLSSRKLRLHGREIEALPRPS